LKEQQNILEQKVIERTSELAEANTQLEEQHERILNQKEEIATQRDMVTQAYENIKVISEFGQKITSVLNLEEVDNMVYEYVNSLMDISAFGVGIYNEQKKIIEFFRFMENGKQIPYFSKDIYSTQSLNVRCFLNKEEIVINELSDDYKNYLLTLPEFHSKQMPQSVVHFPLLTGKKSIGTLTISSLKKNAYTFNDLNNLRSLASYVSIALDNANVYNVVNQQNQHIRSSIEYAQSIQQAILPSKTLLDKYFENFIFFKPRDVVSGDLYWFAALNDYSCLAAVIDCTGHGVPGAFMSLICNRLLNEIIIERNIFDPKEILNELDEGIKDALRQEQTDNKDGMDVCMCRIDKKPDTGNYTITFAGAARPLYLTKGNDCKIETLKGSRRSIGGPKSKRKELFKFTNEIVELLPGNTLYMCTDGYSDQNNKDREKYGVIRLTNFLESVCNLEIEKQSSKIEKEFLSYKGIEEQRDDITIIGIRLI
jgi:serine phosphatase RsbU (regulator of sigma subunit)